MLKSIWDCGCIFQLGQQAITLTSDMADKKSPMSEKLPTSPDKMSDYCLGTKYVISDNHLPVFCVNKTSQTTFQSMCENGVCWQFQQGCTASRAPLTSMSIIHPPPPLRISFCITLTLRAWLGVCIMTGTAFRTDISCYPVLSDESFATRSRPPGYGSIHPVSLLHYETEYPFV